MTTDVSMSRGYTEEMLDLSAAAQKTVLVDIDGTVALMGQRGPFDWNLVGGDIPNMPVIHVVRALSLWNTIAFVSGRDAVCHDETVGWLDEYVCVPGQLYMRPQGDFRKDAVVKREIFDANWKAYDIRLVLDDRNQVVEMWRGLGLTCLQVAPGDF